MNYYFMNYRCSNCLRVFKVRIPHKTEALRFLECPNCGLNEVNKTDKHVGTNIYALDVENEKLVPLPRA